MKSIGALLALVGLVIVGLGLLRHESAFILKGTNHASILIGVVGLVLLVLGAGVTALGRAGEG